MKLITKALVPASLGCFLLIGSAALAQEATSEAPREDGEQIHVRRYARVWRGGDGQERRVEMRHDGDGPGRGSMGAGQSRRGRFSQGDDDGPGRGARGRRGGRRGGPGRRGGGMIGRLLAHAEELGLTDDQQTRIKEIGVAARKAMVQLRADSELARIELEGLIHTEDPDLAAIEDGLQNVASVQVATRLAQIEAGVNVRSVLTDEQQAKIKEHRRGGPGRRGSRGDGPKRGGAQRGRRPQQERH